MKTATSSGHLGFIVTTDCTSRTKRKRVVENIDIFWTTETRVYIRRLGSAAKHEALVPEAPEAQRSLENIGEEEAELHMPVALQIGSRTDE